MPKGGGDVHAEHPVATAENSRQVAQLFEPTRELAAGGVDGPEVEDQSPFPVVARVDAGTGEVALSSWHKGRVGTEVVALGDVLYYPIDIVLMH